MKKQKELAKNTIIIFIGKACTQFISFLLLPLYTAILSNGDYGFIDLVTTYVTLFVPLITLQLETAVFRFLIDARNNTEKQKDIISNSFITCIITSSLILCIFILLNFFIKIKYFCLIIILIYCTLLSNFALQVSRGNGKNTDYAIASTIIGVFTILLNILFLVFLKLGVAGMLMAQSIANLLGFLYILFKSKLYLFISKKNYNKKITKSLLEYSLPLVPNGLIWWIINVSDRTIISIVLDVAANGIYAVSNKFSTIIIQIYNVFNLSWTESAAVHIKDEDKDSFFSETFNFIIQLFISIGILVIGIMPVLFNVMVSSSYADAYNYIPLLIIGTFFNIVVSFIGGIYVALKKTKSIAMTSFLSGVINIIINLFLISKIRIYAAAISTIVAFASMSIYRYIDVQKYVELRINHKKFITLLFCVIVSCILYYKKQLITNIMLFAFSSLLFLVINLKYVVKTFDMMRIKFNKNI